MRKTIVISCAGKGTRLGNGITKALLDLDGKPLIIRQLEMLDAWDDIRIVVGYQAERVIEVVRQYRQNITILFNHDYETTGTAASFSKGILGAAEMIVALDGDLLVRPADLARFLAFDGECVGGCKPTTDNPVLMTLDEDGCVVQFSREVGSMEWTGLAQIKTARITAGTQHVYQLLEPLMPIHVMPIDTQEIDTQHDYERALVWLRQEKAKEV